MTKPPALDDASINGWAAYGVIAVSFEQDDSAYAALPLLKELDSQHRVGIQEAVVVVRSEQGQPAASPRTYQPDQTSPARPPRLCQ